VEKWQIFGLLLVGVLVMVVMVALRARFGEKYELKAIDLAVLVLPLVVGLLMTGRLKGLDMFGVKADFAELFADAAETQVKGQAAASNATSVEQVVELLQMAAKGGVQEIPRLIENRTEALMFRLGQGGYYGPAIQQYFDALYASSYLKYVVVLDVDGRLFGIYDALDLAVAFRTDGDRAYTNLADWLNRPDDYAREALARLPGFIGADKAVSRELSKVDTMRRMDELRVDSLPVVGDDAAFVGTVERSRLTASLILEVAERVTGNPR
jgi:CBS domain-containing protein